MPNENTPSLEVGGGIQSTDDLEAHILPLKGVLIYKISICPTHLLQMPIMVGLTVLSTDQLSNTLFNPVNHIMVDRVGRGQANAQESLTMCGVPHHQVTGYHSLQGMNKYV